jgi:hypothetical protein
MLEVLVLRQPRQGLAAGVNADGEGYGGANRAYPRVASVGDIGWRLCEQFHAVQWGGRLPGGRGPRHAGGGLPDCRPSALDRHRRRRPWHRSRDCSIFLKCRFATPTIVSTLGGGTGASLDPGVAHAELPLVSLHES